MCCGVKTPPELCIMLPNQHIMTLRSPASQVEEAQSIDVEAQCMTVLPVNIANSISHGHGFQSNGRLKSPMVDASKRDQGVLASCAAMTIAAMAHTPELWTGCQIA